MYGNKIVRGHPMIAGPRSVVGELDTSNAGNVILRVGKENADLLGWHGTEHVVLTPAEALELAAEIKRLACGPLREHPGAKVAGARAEAHGRVTEEVAEAADMSRSDGLGVERDDRDHEGLAELRGHCDPSPLDSYDPETGL